jgi:hypothetical protein
MEGPGSVQKVMDLYPEGPKTYISYGSGSTTLFFALTVHYNIKKDKILVDQRG